MTGSLTLSDLLRSIQAKARPGRASQRVHALRRDGSMNKTEGRYGQHLSLLAAAGKVSNVQYQPMKLRLAKSTFFDPDFGYVDATDQSYCLVDVKGGPAEDDAQVKIKVAAEMFPQFRLFQARERGRSWELTEFFPTTGTGQ